MARASTPAVLNAEIDGRSVGLFVGEDGGVYTRLNGRQRRVANGVCAVPVGAREASGIAQGVYWSAERIPVKHLNQRPTLYWPNRHRHEPWAPDDAWLEDEEEYRHLEQRARRPRPPKLPNLPMVWEEVPTVRRRIALQARDLELFRHLARFGVEVSTRIAYEFFAGRDLTACQRRLKALAEGGYLARGRPQLSRGSVPYVYRLTAAGFEAGQAHHDAEGDPFIPTDRKWTGRVGGGAQSLEHDLRG
ncbi:MAG: replication-relaxation family protein, partial [Thermoleophilaceae bacterium]